MATACLPAACRHAGGFTGKWAKLEEDLMFVGNRVTVLQPFDTNSQTPCPLLADVKGEVIDINGDSHALIKFDGIPTNQWILKTNFHQLLNSQGDIMSVGNTVTVLQPFNTNSQTPCPLLVDVKGEVIDMNGDSHALIKFDGIPTNQWVLKTNFPKLLSSQVTSSRGASGFVCFGGAPIATGVFRCMISFRAPREGEDESQHVGVLPISAANVATTESFWDAGFADGKIKGWGCRLQGMQKVTAGEFQNGGHGVKFSGKTVEMVVDAAARTVIIGNPRGPQCRFDEVVFPVIPAINIFQNTAILESSSHKMTVAQSSEAKLIAKTKELKDILSDDLQDLLLKKMAAKMAAAMEQKSSEKVAELEQKLVAAQQMMAEEKEATSKIFAAQDKEAIALRAEIARQAEAIRRLEVGLEKALASQRS